MFCSLTPLRSSSGRERTAPAAPAGSRRALVGFVNRPATRLHRLLCPGFRHCFALIDDGPGWVLIDPLKDRIEVRRLDTPGEFDLAAFYVRRGHRVLEGRVRPQPRNGAVVLDLCTCVSVVKRALGIVGPRVHTPHQLYRHLREAHDPPFLPKASVEKEC